MLIGELQAAIAEQEARPWWNYKLPAPLEQRYHTEREAGRARQLRIWAVVTLSLTWSTLALDFLVMPRMWPWFVSERVLLITPLFLWAMLRIDGDAGPILKLLMVAGPYCALPIAVPLTFALAPTIDPVVVVLAQLSIVLWITAMVPMGVRGMLCFCAVALVAGDGVIAGAFQVHHVKFHRPDIVAVCHLTVMLMLLGRVLNERELRRSFVAGLRMQVRAESLARSNAQLLELSNTDALTGLSNRRAFDERLAAAVTHAVTAKAAVALLMIDIDFFKQFNDTAGHPEGDRCLATVARAIGREVRATDFAARYGGEEFVVILPGAELQHASALAERIRVAIGVLRVYHPGLGNGRCVTISIGVSALRAGAADADPAALVADADAALYAAKHAGRDQVATIAAGRMTAARDV